VALIKAKCLACETVFVANTKLTSPYRSVHCPCCDGKKKVILKYL